MRIDNYTLTRQLGVNAFGPVWEARESITERLVSINILSSADEYQIARFCRAIALLSRLNHPRIAVHTGHGFIGHSPYLATAHVHGPTLATLMTQGGRMDELKVLQIALQVAEGLGHAWEKASVIHRNLGPQTIAVDARNMAVESETLNIHIIDFGHALGERLIDIYDPEAVAQEAAFQKAATKDLVGSPMTMSPEQVAGARLTVASDMYALGVTMYLLLTGAAPFSGTDDEVKASHQRVQPLELRSLVPGLQAHTAALVKRLLSKTPGARFADWEICQQRIREAVDSIGRCRQTAAPAMSVQRRAETFEKTPVGKPIPMGPPIPESTLVVPPRYSQSYTPSSVVPQSLASQPPSSGTKQFWVQPSGLSADDVRLLATHAANLRRARAGASLTQQTPMLAGAPVATSEHMSPAVDDGLTAEQRLAMWVHLFRSPAIADASLSKHADAQFQTHSPSEIPAVFHQALTHKRRDSRAEFADEQVAAADSQIETDAEVDAEADAEVDAEADASVPEAEAQSFAELFAESTPTVTVSDVAPNDDQGVAAPADLACNPLQSRFWNHTLEILRDATLGTVRYEARSPQSLTRRVTRSFLGLVASREPSREEILALILSGKFDEAEAHINKIVLSIKRDNTSGLDDGVCLLRAKLMGLRGDLPGALAWAQQAIRLNSSDPVALALVGVVHLQQRRVQTAVRVFGEVAKLYPQSPLGPLGQAAVFFLGGLESKAELAIAEARRRQAHPALISLQALRCRGRGDDEGEAVFLQVLLTGTSTDWAIQERLREIVGGRSRSV
jgi:serine/threonine protein kinase/tetratricopeptide (TPR) repeat protein